MIFDQFFGGQKGPDPSEKRIKPKRNTFGFFDYNVGSREKIAEQGERRATEKVTDSLTLLENQMDKLKMGNTIPVSVAFEGRDRNVRAPWAVQEHHNYFSTTSRQYGGHYIR